MSDAMLDVLTLVSSDKRFPLELTSLMASGEVRLVHTFRTGSECLRALSLDDLASRRLVLIDNLVSDISPANLCDAIRLAHPNLSIVMVVEQDDVEGVQRAMLAGAKATISRQASVVELTCVLERVVETALQHDSQLFAQTGHGGGLSGFHSGQNYAGSYGDYGQRAVLVPFIGARGGAGRSSLSSSLAYLAAEAHIDTALIDFDLQFGDLSFLFGATGQQVAACNTFKQDESYALRGDVDLFAFLEEAAQGRSQLRRAESLRKFGRQLAPNLRLYAPRAVPEKTESLAQLLPAALERLRCEHELLLINTGAYWTLFHSELIEQSDLAICVLDQSVVGVRATIELRELCRRLGIPASRLLFVMNRAQKTGLRPQDIADVLLAERVFCIHDAGEEFSALFDAGDFAQLLHQTSFMAELYEILDEIAIRSDLCIHDAISLRFSMRREAGTRLSSSAWASDAVAGGSHAAAHGASVHRRKGLLRRA